MADDRGVDKKKVPPPFKRRFSLDIIRTPRNIFRRTSSTVEAQMRMLEIRGVEDEPITTIRDRISPDHKKEKVFGVLHLESGGHLVVSIDYMYTYSIYGIVF
ncbi:hypothetical protein SNE40_020060 [Patella caerulea]|uniref:Uncharacterized protein n=1 Tax=Patella caerulea TaxID=87958 RepID=A0AAN8IY63_PATCE